MSAPDPDGWKKLIEEARQGLFPDECGCGECEIALRLAAALDSAVAHIGRLEAQRGEVLAIVRDYGDQTFVITAGEIVRVLSRTEDDTQ